MNSDLEQNLAAFTADVFLGDRLIVRQPRQGYRAGVDAVLLAATAGSGGRAPRTLLDVGSGAGTVGLCAASRLPALQAVLLERDPAFVALARDNIAANGLADRVCAVEADVGAPAAQLDALGLRPDSFDAVLANPPYHDSDAGTPAPHALKADAHAMPSDALETWARFMARMVRRGGRVTLVHKAEALPRVLAAFATRFGALIVLPIHPRAGEDAIRVIVSGIKGNRAPLSLRAPFVLHGIGQEFTEEARSILRSGAALDLCAPRQGA